MHTYSESLASSLFLCDHEALTRFAGLVSNRDPARGDAEGFVVVCERKEDLLAVRAMIAHHVHTQVPGSSIAGVTMYTLDALSETLMKSLALTPDAGLLSPTLKADFRKPFLDVVTQEKLLRVLLLRLRFPAGDALSTAKQILTLLDVPFPEGENLFTLLLETQRLELGQGARETKLTETAFKQILCAYQGAQNLFPHFSRLQRLVFDYLETDFRAHVRQLAGAIGSEGDAGGTNAAIGPGGLLAFPRKFLNSHMLWCASPEYGDPARRKEGYRPGNFQKFIVNGFRDALFFARECLSPDGAETLHARCYLSTADPKRSHALAHVEARVVAPRRRLWEEATRHCNTPAASGRELVLLADFPLDEERLYHARAHGTHALHEEVLTAFATGNLTPAEIGEENAWNELVKDLNSRWDDLSEAVSLLDYFSRDLEATAHAYGLTVLSARDRDFLELWKSHCIGESARVGDAHPLSLLPRALSYFAVDKAPESIVALGPPHASRAPSFIVKILNDTLAALAKKGTEVELPANDESYRGFYLWLASLGVPLQFWIPSLSAFQGFPEHLSHKHGVRITTDAIRPAWRTRGALATALERTAQEASGGLAADMRVSDTRWSEHLSASKDAKRGAGALTLNITQFERYVECPLKFYLVDVLRLQQNSEDFTTPPPKETGEAVHRVAEYFVSLYKLVGTDKETLHEANAARVRYLARMRAIVESPEFLVDAPREMWEEVFLRETRAVVGASHRDFLYPTVRDFVTALFVPSFTSPSVLRMQLTVELVKRAFLRLLITEHRRLSEDPALEVGGFPEQTVELALAGVRLRGRVDRVDFSPRGYHIIDYKASKVAKTHTKLALFPADCTSDSVRLSVQGALYSLAWAALRPESPVADFSLYRLKNLDPDVDVMLCSTFAESPFFRGSPSEERMRETYEPIADRLAHGNFDARPLHKNTCSNCPGYHTCAVPRAREVRA